MDNTHRYYAERHRQSLSQFVTKLSSDKLDDKKEHSRLLLKSSINSSLLPYFQLTYKSHLNIRLVNILDKKDPLFDRNRVDFRVSKNDIIKTEYLTIDQSLSIPGDEYEKAKFK